MEQPQYILETGTEVVTASRLKKEDFLIVPRILKNRSPATKGKIKGVVGGHGGDVYFVTHGEDKVAAYGWWEFDLVDRPEAKP